MSARRRVLALAAATVGLGAAEAVVGLAVGHDTGSVALTVLGVVSGLAVAAALALVWEVGGSRTAGTGRALEAVAAAWVVTALYAALAGVRGLLAGDAPDGSALGVAAAAGAALCLPALALAKVHLARDTGDPALRADVTRTRLDAVVAAVVLVAVALEEAAGWGWADGLACLALAMLLLREGLRGLR